MSNKLDIPAGRVIGGEFRVIAPLAEGGMGAVYVAEQLSTGKRRALKLMHLQIAADQPSRERFVREAQVGSRIESEHVVEVILAGIDSASGLPWLAMELLEGASLATIVAKRGPMPAADVARIYRQVGHALSAAHRVGVVHRDLKPDNVFVATAKRSDTPFTVKILDFGIAKLVASATSAHNSQLIGSPLWMAPEQLQTDAPIGPATDIWALGLIAFHLLTGRFYWRAASTGDVGIHALITEMVVAPMVPASDRAALLGAQGNLPSGFDEWFARTTVREAGARWANVDEVVASLIEILERVPVVSPPLDVSKLGATATFNEASAPTLPATPAVSRPHALGATMVGSSGTTKRELTRESAPTGLAGSTAPMGVRGPTVDERARPVAVSASDRTPAPIARTGPVANEPRRGSPVLWVAGVIVAVLGASALGGAIYLGTRNGETDDPSERVTFTLPSPERLEALANADLEADAAEPTSLIVPPTEPVPAPTEVIALDAGTEVAHADEPDASAAAEPPPVTPANSNSLTRTEAREQARTEGIAATSERAAASPATGAATPPTPTRGGTTPTPITGAPTGQAPTDRDSQIRACGGNSQCLVRAIGRPQNARESALLIESHRSSGNQAQARREMERFVAQYPAHPRANQYRQQLGRSSPTPVTRPVETPRTVRVTPVRPTYVRPTPVRPSPGRVAPVPPNPF